MLGFDLCPYVTLQKNALLAFVFFNRFVTLSTSLALPLPSLLLLRPRASVRIAKFKNSKALRTKQAETCPTFGR
jgi:hypothetical protein